MSYIAAITDKTTGETQNLPFEEAWAEHFDYLWSDGNFGCDCNRAQFFSVASGRMIDRPCGIGRFFVSIWSEGKIVFADADDSEDL